LDSWNLSRSISRRTFSSFSIFSHYRMCIKYIKLSTIFIYLILQFRAGVTFRLVHLFSQIFPTFTMWILLLMIIIERCAYLLENISAKSRSYNLKSLMGWNGTKAPPSSSPASPPSSSPPRPFPLPRPAEAFPPRGSLLSFPLPRPLDFPFEDEASCLPDGAVAPSCVPFVWVSCTRNNRCATSDTSRGFAIEIGMNRVLSKSFVYNH